MAKICSRALQSLKAAAFPFSNGPDAFVTAHNFFHTLCINETQSNEES